MAIRLGINIDHIATLRNARGENDPSLPELLFEVQEGGADLITMHLREDRRHIQDNDLAEVMRHSKLPINLEMALTEEMTQIACGYAPASVSIVPEKREELTTEGGLNVQKIGHLLEKSMQAFQEKDIQVFLFIEPQEKDILLAGKMGVTGIEIHTGVYARNFLNPIRFKREMEKIKKAAQLCRENDLELHAGHGLNYHNVRPLLEIEDLLEVNIGHAVIAYALKTGIRRAVSQMKDILSIP